jgi:hypothetical protein
MVSIMVQEKMHFVTPLIKSIMKKVFILGKALILWAIGIALLVLIASTWQCTSKSGNLALDGVPDYINTKELINKPATAIAERVVIIQETSITYKVQRIDKGIVDYITIPDYYLPGDTIQVTFN